MTVYTGRREWAHGAPPGSGPCAPSLCGGGGGDSLGDGDGPVVLRGNGGTSSTMQPYALVTYLRSLPGQGGSCDVHAESPVLGPCPVRPARVGRQ